MKRWRNAALAIGLACLLLSSCAAQETSSKEEIDMITAIQQLNQNSDFASYQLLRSYDGPDTFTNPFLSVRDTYSIPLDSLPEPVYILNDAGERQLSGYYSFYPVDSDDLLLTEIIISGGSFHVFGVSVGDDLTIAVEILMAEGYVEQASEGPYHHYRSTASDKKTILRHGDILIVLQVYKSDPAIKQIIIDVWRPLEEDNTNIVY